MCGYVTSWSSKENKMSSLSGALWVCVVMSLVGQENKMSSLSGALWVCVVMSLVGQVKETKFLLFQELCGCVWLCH